MVNHRFYIIAILLTTSVSQAQETATPLFDIHLGAGVVSGGRIGVRAVLTEQLSIEATYGSDVRNFIGLSDIEHRYGFGANWLINPESNLVLSIIGVRSRRPQNIDFYSYFVSGNVGFLSLRFSGLHYFARLGPHLEFHHDYTGNSTEFGFNLDVGINLVFP